MKINYEFDLTNEKDVKILDYIICGAIEGGIGYWASLDNSKPQFEDKPKETPVSEWVIKLLIKGQPVTFFDTEDDSEVWLLTLEKLIKGIGMNASERPFDTDFDNMDIISYDCIFQYALFEEIVYC